MRGLDCAEEIATLRRALADVPGVSGLGFDLLGQRLHVEHDEGTELEGVCRAVAAVGMSAELLAGPDAGRQPPGPGEGRWRGRPRAALLRDGGTLVATVALVTGFVLHAHSTGLPAALSGTSPPPLVPPAYLLATLAAMGPLLPRVVAAARRLQPDMHLLMALAVTGALLLGEWFEAATVALLFELSLRLEAGSTRRARRAVEALFDRTPTLARLLSGEPGESAGRERLVPAAAVRRGDRLRVLPGERVPVDGTVTAGRSYLDESLLTGESCPVERACGDDVVAGSVNGPGTIELVASGGAADSTAARVAELVSGAAARRGPAERFVERFARVYTPLVLLAAMLLAVLPPLAGMREARDAFHDALVLLVIACPCALVLSVPVAVVCALASAAQRGVLIKGGASLEAAASPRCIAFDKTGTLTTGRPQLLRVAPRAGQRADEVLAAAAAVEAHSGHPLALAISAAARVAGLEVPEASAVTEQAGLGAEGLVGGVTVRVGSGRHLAGYPGCGTTGSDAELAAAEAQGHTVVVVGRAGEVCGHLVFGDAPRPEAAAVLAELRALGAGPLVLLTGDNASSAGALAGSLALDEVRAGLLPAEKLAAIEELGARHGRVAMVGDGVNDAPALARADLGIALAGGGRDLALQSADVVLLAPRLAALPWLVRHARRLAVAVRTNVALALGVKLVFLALAAAGQATLWSAIAADMGVSLLVVLNGMRLLRGGPG